MSTTTLRNRVKRLRRSSAGDDRYGCALLAEDEKTIEGPDGVIFHRLEGEKLPQFMGRAAAAIKAATGCRVVLHYDYLDVSFCNG